MQWGKTEPLFEVCCDKYFGIWLETKCVLISRIMGIDRFHVYGYWVSGNLLWRISAWEREAMTF